MTTQSQWTAPQLAAINHITGDLLVSAAAGSGKTAGPAQPCARLVCDVNEEGGGGGVENLLVLTFTEAAATEMRTRIAQAIREKLKNNPTPRLHRQAAMIERASISTLHVFCAKTLRQHFEQVHPHSPCHPVTLSSCHPSTGLDPTFEVMDEDDARLLREDTLANLFAHWHKNPPNGFPDFFDAYVQARESNLQALILRVHNMLESTADPDAYLATVRHRYTDPDATMNHYAQTTLTNELRLIQLTATRACKTITNTLGPSPMLDGLQNATQLINWSLTQLQERSTDAIASIKSTLDFKWPTLYRPKDHDEAEFETLKKQTWEAVKSALSKFCKITLSIPTDHLRKDLINLAAEGGPLETLLDLATQFRTAYATAKRQKNRLDFADLERLTLNLLTWHRHSADELRQRYKHILVDEFQDINPLQAAILNAIRSPDHGGNLFVVGDIKQSIYSFRLADPNLFLQLEKKAKTAPTPQSGGATYINLPNNFRSDPNLLTTMNAIFEKILTPELTGITYTDGHALAPPPNTPHSPGLGWDGAPLTELHLVTTNQDNDDENETLTEPLTAIEQEANLVANRITQLITSQHPITLKDGTTRPIQYRDIAILLRSLKNKAPAFVRALTQHGIPVHADLSTGYFDAPEIAYTLNLLRTLDNPRQDIPLTSTMLSPYAPQPFTHDDLAQIRLAYDKSIPFHEAVTRYTHNQAQGLQSLGLRLANFLTQLELWRAKLLTQPLHEALSAIFVDARIFPCLAGLDAGQQRIANLQNLHQRALKFTATNGGNLHQFLRFLDTLIDQSNTDYGEAPVLSEASDVVRIMSVHKSKGLEFPIVFVSNLGRKFNSRDITSSTISVHRDLGIALQISDPTRNIFYPSVLTHIVTESNNRSLRAEELRLLYVALTRAKNRLILTGHINKEERIDMYRNLWQNHKAPLPEDILLRANSPLDWLLPTLAAANLNIITTHKPNGTHLGSPTTTLPRGALETQVSDIDLTHLHARITGHYAHQPLTQQPAVLTVTQLKKQTIPIPDEEVSSIIQFVPPQSKIENQKSKIQNPLARGIATHRILELLDFATTPDTLPAQIRHLIQTNRLTPDEATIADTIGIQWLLTTPIAARLRDPAHTMYREIPFIWTNASENPADHPTIRGIIDLLLVNPAAQTAEILDYKTDSLTSLQANTYAYRQQMRYYLQAASQILQFPVTHATLIYLTPRTTEEIHLT
ncbi:MAG: UvrD-helicase domain-containing protein [Phycisphaerales bacterium]|nr:UvrD-helicase domain-containing protein [Phycisphaerales bacterium]